MKSQHPTKALDRDYYIHCGLLLGSEKPKRSIETTTCTAACCWAVKTQHLTKRPLQVQKTTIYTAACWAAKSQHPSKSLDKDHYIHCGLSLGSEKPKRSAKAIRTAANQVQRENLLTTRSALRCRVLTLNCQQFKTTGVSQAAAAEAGAEAEAEAKEGAATATWNQTKPKKAQEVSVARIGTPCRWRQLWVAGGA